ncbi:MAG: glycosyltransferase family 4 protein [Caldilineales bacterium]|nr:glycosyltransferase family 4 protein [Caldilineales bacterium]
MDPLRILFVTGEYPPMEGGVADYTCILGRTLAAMGQEVAVLTSAAAGVAPVAGPPTVFARVSRWDWGMWRALDERIASWRPDVVHIQYQTAAFGMHPAVNLWAWRPWRRPTPLTAVTFHDLKLPYLFPKAQPLRRWVTTTLARCVDLVITTNPEDTAQARVWRPDVVEIPIGSNIAAAPPPAFDRARCRAELGLAADAALIGYFGFLNASKGGEVLVEVLARLVAAGRDIHLLMVGGRTGASDPTNVAYLERVEARIAALGLAERVHWTGHLPAEEVSAALLATDVCLLPYRDGASYRRGSFMAALAHGLPIVTTTPAVPYPDLVDGETVLLAQPDDVAGLTAAVARVLDDPALRVRLGQGAARLAQRFRWEDIAAATLRAYHDALVRRRSL